MKNWTDPGKSYYAVRWALAGLLLLSVTSATALPSSVVRAQVSPDGLLGPSTTVLSYQGHLLDAAGAPVEGSIDIIFRLFYDAEGGSPFWTESHTAANAVEVSEGLFHVLLGSLTLLDPDVLVGDLYLELEVAGDTLAPRELLTSAPYAVEARTLADGAVTRGDLTTDGTLAVLGNLGVGTSEPEAALDIVGGMLFNEEHSEFYTADGTYPGTIEIGLGKFLSRSTVQIQGYASGSGDNSAFHAIVQIPYATVDLPVAVYAADTGSDPNTVYQVLAERVSGNDVRLWATFEMQGADPGDAHTFEVVVRCNKPFDRADVGSVDNATEIAPVHFVDGRFGNVGIGTTAPTSSYDRSPVLHILGTNMPGIVLESGSDTWAGKWEMMLAGAPSPQEATLRFKTGDLNVLTLRQSGYIGVGITEPSQKLHVDGKIYATDDLWSDSNLSVYGQAFIGEPGVGEGGEIVLQEGATGSDVVIDNYFGNFRVHQGGSNLLTAEGDGVYATRFASPGSQDLTIDAGGGTINTLHLHDDVHVSGDLQLDGSCVGGAYVEANLQTEDERAAGAADRFEEGDVLCWGIEQLELCSQAGDRLVQAVADAQGRPIVMGAEVIKVLGPVHRGDILVASNVPGYAMVDNDPPTGAIIAQALEDFEGERGLIKAMIRKF